MSTAPGGSAGFRSPLAGAGGALRAFHTGLSQGSGSLRAVVGRVNGAEGAVSAFRASVAADSGALGRFKAGAEATAGSVTRTGHTAATASAGIGKAGAGSKGSAKSLGRLLSGLGGVTAVVAGLLATAGPLGDLLGSFGTLMTIGSGVLLVVNALTRANPIGFITGLLLPVAGQLLDLAMSSETGQKLMERLAALVLKYVEGYLTVMAPLLRAVASAVNTYVTGYLALVTTALTAVGALIGTGFAVLRALTTGDTRELSGRVSALWRGFRDGVRPALKWITDDIPRLFTRVKEATARTLGALGGFVTTGAQTVAAVVKGPVQGLVAFANQIIDGLNSLSFSILGKRFGVRLDRIPMLADGGVAVPGATLTGGRVLPLTGLDRPRAPARRHRAAAGHPHRVEEFHESRRDGARGTAEDLLFLAAAHGRT